MSAFMCSFEHLNVLATVAIEGFGGGRFPRLLPNHDDPKDVAMLLAAENAASVAARYPDHPEMQSPDWATNHDAYPYKYPMVRPTPVELLKLIDCYEYQSCEHDAWEHSTAHALCERLRSYAIHHLDGYEDAPWEWRRS